MNSIRVPCISCKQRGDSMSFHTWLPIQINIDREILPAEPLHLKGTLCGICGHVELTFDGLPDVYIKQRHLAAKALHTGRKKQAEKMKKVH